MGSRRGTARGAAKTSKLARIVQRSYKRFGLQVPLLRNSLSSDVNICIIHLCLYTSCEGRAVVSMLTLLLNLSVLITFIYRFFLSKPDWRRIGMLLVVFNLIPIILIIVINSLFKSREFLIVGYIIIV